MHRLFTSCFGFSICLATALHGAGAFAEGKSEITIKRLPEIVQPAKEVARPSQDFATADKPSTVVQPPVPHQPAAPPIQSSVPRSHLGARPAVVAQPLYEPPLPNQTRQALAFYGGYSARTTLSQMPRRAPIQPAPSRRLHGPTKPFQNLSYDPPLSPYLNLEREEQDTDLPNYFTYVRPQMEQLQLNQMQQRELQQLRGQVQSMSSPTAGTQYQSMRPSGGAPARFMDTAQFYGGWR
jgi:hypothetical protein